MALSGYPADPQPNTQDPESNTGTDGHKRDAGANVMLAQARKAKTSAPRPGRSRRGTHPTDAAPGADGAARSEALSEDEQVAVVRGLRKEIAGSCRVTYTSEPSPIRVMARMVREVQEAALKAGVSRQVLEREVVNRTIGDVNVRWITEDIGGVDYSTIGEDLGLIIPGEEIAGRVSDGRMRLEMERREQEIELRLLRDYNWDMRVYDLFGVGNPLLREMLAARFKKAWGIPTHPDFTFISIGGLDALYKSLLSLGNLFKKKYGIMPTFGFPSPGFAVVNWQAEAIGLKLLNIRTTEQSRFKLTYRQMKEMLAADPELRLLYFTVSNNPTAFSYSPAQIRDVFRAIEEDGRELAVLADLAYIGTGIPSEDLARMQAFNTPEALRRTLFINSLSKVFTLTGDRCGWVSLWNPEWADMLRVGWNNTTAGLPAQWQLRFTAYIELFDERPEIQAKIRSLYTLRRDHFRGQLLELNAEYDLFEEIGVDDHTAIYNWSKLKPGEDALTVFEKTGVAGVPGTAFGYDDQYIRFSVGFIPIK